MTPLRRRRVRFVPEPPEPLGPRAAPSDLFAFQVGGSVVLVAESDPPLDDGFPPSPPPAPPPTGPAGPA